MYQIQISRGGRDMTVPQAAEMVANGFRVTVLAVSGPNSFPSDYWAEITAVNGTDAVDRARINFAPLRRLDSAGAAAVASVAVTASEVAMSADKLMADRDAAITAVAG